MRFFRSALIMGGLAASLTVTACAKPPIVPPPLEAPPAPLPPPVQPAPPPPVVAAPVTPAPLPMPPAGPTPGSSQDFVVNVGDRVYFDLDQFSIRPDAQTALASQATWLARYPNVSIRIEGNADERGTREYNLALGSRRANAVRDFLVARGVAASRITTMSYGKERPLDPGTGDAAWARNRNAQTVVVQ